MISSYGVKTRQEAESLFIMLVISENLCEGSLKADSSVLIYLSGTIRDSFWPCIMLLLGVRLSVITW
jgi:hypothetical protein